jgi:hypothetical protein
MVERVQKALNWFLVVSCFGHIFCCGLPAAASVVGAGLSFGLISTNFIWLEQFHEQAGLFLVVSGVVLLVTGILQWVGSKLDCHNTGCSHPPCDSSKRKSLYLFYVATGLFVLNFLVHIALEA